MSHAIHISDEAYQKLEQLAQDSGESPESVVEGFVYAATASTREPHYYELDEWFRHLGMTDEEMAEADAELEAEDAADADAR